MPVLSFELSIAVDLFFVKKWQIATGIHQKAAELFQFLYELRQFVNLLGHVLEGGLYGFSVGWMCIDELQEWLLFLLGLHLFYLIL